VSPETTRSLLWLPGPLIAIGLVSLSVLNNSGPGFFLLAVFAGFGFMIVAPLVQIVLLRTSRFRGRYAAACRAALTAVTACVFFASLTGAFNFW
jgi:hypothetical protein